jgi:hypothetical protein
MPDTYYSGDDNGSSSRPPVSEVSVSSKYFDGHVTIEVDTDPHVHAQKLHALIAGLDAVHESDKGEFGTKEQSEIMGWLIYMARNESAAMMKSFAEELSQTLPNG